ncbi:uncharacterized protein [Palaemon carinicauda]|uniref:uncharacterized protein n=1 Tax=Palaemon carinicauda TaxID=392227 RepID=UPI0035B6882E
MEMLVHVLQLEMHGFPDRRLKEILFHLPRHWTWELREPFASIEKWRDTAPRKVENILPDDHTERRGDRDTKKSASTELRSEIQVLQEIILNQKKDLSSMMERNFMIEKELERERNAKHCLEERRRMLKDVCDFYLMERNLEKDVNGRLNAKISKLNRNLLQREQEVASLRQQLDRDKCEHDELRNKMDLEKLSLEKKFQEVQEENDLLRKEVARLREWQLQKEEEDKLRKQVFKEQWKKRDEELERLQKELERERKMNDCLIELNERRKNETRIPVLTWSDRRIIEKSETKLEGDCDFEKLVEGWEEDSGLIPWKRKIHKLVEKLKEVERRRINKDRRKMDQTDVDKKTLENRESGGPPAQKQLVFIGSVNRGSKGETNETEIIRCFESVSRGMTLQKDKSWLGVPRLSVSTMFIANDYIGKHSLNRANLDTYLRDVIDCSRERALFMLYKSVQETSAELVRHDTFDREMSPLKEQETSAELVRHDTFDRMSPLKICSKTGVPVYRSEDILRLVGNPVKYCRDMFTLKGIYSEYYMKLIDESLKHHEIPNLLRLQHLAVPKVMGISSDRNMIIVKRHQMTMYEWLVTKRPSWKEVLSFMIKLAGIVEDFHAEGICHNTFSTFGIWVDLSRTGKVQKIIMMNLACSREIGTGFYKKWGGDRMRMPMKIFYRGNCTPNTDAWFLGHFVESVSRFFSGVSSLFRDFLHWFYRCNGDEAVCCMEMLVHVLQLEMHGFPDRRLKEILFHLPRHWTWELREPFASIEKWRDTAPRKVENILPDDHTERRGDRDTKKSASTELRSEIQVLQEIILNQKKDLSSMMERNFMIEKELERERNAKHCLEERRRMLKDVCDFYLMERNLEKDVNGRLNAKISKLNRNLLQREQEVASLRQQLDRDKCEHDELRNKMDLEKLSLEKKFQEVQEENDLLRKEVARLREWQLQKEEEDKLRKQVFKEQWKKRDEELERLQKELERERKMNDCLIELNERRKNETRIPVLTWSDRRIIEKSETKLEGDCDFEKLVEGWEEDSGLIPWKRKIHKLVEKLKEVERRRINKDRRKMDQTDVDKKTLENRESGGPPAQKQLVFIGSVNRGSKGETNETEIIRCFESVSRGMTLQKDKSWLGVPRLSVSTMFIANDYIGKHSLNRANLDTYLRDVIDCSRERALFMLYKSVQETSAELVRHDTFDREMSPLKEQETSAELVRHDTFDRMSPLKICSKTGVPVYRSEDILRLVGNPVKYCRDMFTLKGIYSEYYMKLIDESLKHHEIPNLLRLQHLAVPKVMGISSDRNMIIVKRHQMTMYEWLVTKRPSWKEVLSFMIKLAGIVEDFHAEGICHNTFSTFGIWVDLSRTGKVQKIIMMNLACSREIGTGFYKKWGGDRMRMPMKIFYRGNCTPNTDAWFLGHFVESVSRFFSGVSSLFRDFLHWFYRCNGDEAVCCMEMLVHVLQLEMHGFPDRRLKEILFHLPRHWTWELREPFASIEKWRDTAPRKVENILPDDHTERRGDRDTKKSASTELRSEIQVLQEIILNQKKDLSSMMERNFMIEKELERERNAKHCLEERRRMLKDVCDFYLMERNLEKDVNGRLNAKISKLNRNLLQREQEVASLRQQLDRDKCEHDELRNKMDLEKLSLEKKFQEVQEENDLLRKEVARLREWQLQKEEEDKLRKQVFKEQWKKRDEELERLQKELERERKMNDCLIELNERRKNETRIPVLTWSDRRIIEKSETKLEGDCDFEKLVEGWEEDSGLIPWKRKIHKLVEKLKEVERRRINKDRRKMDQTDVDKKTLENRESGGPPAQKQLVFIGSVNRGSKGETNETEIIRCFESVSRGMTLQKDKSWLGVPRLSVSTMFIANDYIGKHSLNRANLDTYLRDVIDCSRERALFMLYKSVQETSAELVRHDTFDREMSPLKEQETSAELVRHDTFDRMSPLKICSKTGVPVYRSEDILRLVGNPVKYCRDMFTLKGIYSEYYMKLIDESLKHHEIPNLLRLQHLAVPKVMGISSDRNMIIVKRHQMTMYEWLVTKRPSWKEVLSFMIKLAGIVEDFHAEGICHNTFSTFGIWVDLSRTGKVQKIIMMNLACSREIGTGFYKKWGGDRMRMPMKIFYRGNCTPNTDAWFLGHFVESVSCIFSGVSSLFRDFLHWFYRCNGDETVCCMEMLVHVLQLEMHGFPDRRLKEILFHLPRHWTWELREPFASIEKWRETAPRKVENILPDDHTERRGDRDTKKSASTELRSEIQVLQEIILNQKKDLSSMMERNFMIEKELERERNAKHCLEERRRMLKDVCDFYLMERNLEKDVNGRLNAKISKLNRNLLQREQEVASLRQQLDRDKCEHDELRNKMDLEKLSLEKKFQEVQEENDLLRKEIARLREWQLQKEEEDKLRKQVFKEQWKKRDEELERLQKELERERKMNDCLIELNERRKIETRIPVLTWSDRRIIEKSETKLEGDCDFEKLVEGWEEDSGLIPWKRKIHKLVEKLKEVEKRRINKDRRKMDQTDVDKKTLENRESGGPPAQKQLVFIGSVNRGSKGETKRAPLNCWLQEDVNKSDQKNGEQMAKDLRSDSRTLPEKKGCKLISKLKEEILSLKRDLSDTRQENYSIKGNMEVERRRINKDGRKMDQTVVDKKTLEDRESGGPPAQKQLVFIGSVNRGSKGETKRAPLNCWLKEDVNKSDQKNGEQMAKDLKSDSQTLPKTKVYKLISKLKKEILSLKRDLSDTRQENYSIKGKINREGKGKSDLTTQLETTEKVTDELNSILGKLR